MPAQRNTPSRPPSDADSAASSTSLSDTIPASPYSRRKVRTKRPPDRRAKIASRSADDVVDSDHHQRPFESPRSRSVVTSRSEPPNRINPFVFDFDSAPHSPYSQRRPAGSAKAARLYNRESFRNNNADWTDTSSSEMDEITTKMVGDAADVHSNNSNSPDHIALPVELHRHQSMASLRSRRDPLYQGMRSRRARRVIDKTGDRNVAIENIPQRSWLFLKDFVTTLIDSQWRLVITLFAASFFCCWLLFAVLWYLIAHAHGDLDFDPVTGVRLNDGTVTCVEGAFTFAGFLLLSIETQVSIGFGSKYPNEECPEAVFLMAVQVIAGIALEGAMVGIVYAKMSRPSGRARTGDLKFSRRAVVCQRDGRLCVVFRVGDALARHAVDTSVKAYWVEERCSAEGERMRQYQHLLKLENGGRSFLIFPTTMCHVIDADSPLYDLSAKDLLEKRFELIITLTGSSRSTGQMTQSRTSYLPRELLWGYRFANLTSFDRLNDTYQADYDRFDSLVQVDTPLCSARRLAEVLADCHELVKQQEAEAQAQDAHVDADAIYGDTPSTMTADVMQEQNSANQERVQMRHLERLAEELEYRLSNHSLHFEQFQLGQQQRQEDEVSVIVIDTDAHRQGDNNESKA